MDSVIFILAVYFLIGILVCELIVVRIAGRKAWQEMTPTAISFVGATLIVAAFWPIIVPLFLAGCVKRALKGRPIFEEEEEGD